MGERWYGWLRRDKRHKWRRVCGPCVNLSDCSRILSARAKEEGVLDRHAVMTTGDEPRNVQPGKPVAALSAEGVWDAIFDDP